MKLYFLLLTSVIALALWVGNYWQQNLYSNFTTETIFRIDHQSQQQVLRNINLYPNIYLARLFQNKAVIIFHKYFDSLFSLLDPNYYFFGSHPREVINGRNYLRLPLFAIAPIFWFFLFAQDKNKKQLLILFALVIASLSLLVNHFQYDFVLWPFFFLFIYRGLSALSKKLPLFTNLLAVAIIVETYLEIYRFR